jgi:pSer/pThr/pTyr-binding forkhead associated (FHA) protein
MGADLFASQYPDFVLVVAVPSSLAHDGTLMIGGYTTTLTDLSTNGASSKSGRADRQLVAPVKKASNSTGNRITVGRTNTCDVVLPFPMVSKLHAVITFDENNQHVVSDSGSKNGTFVDGRPLAARHDVPLPEGAELSFGSLNARFLSPRGLYKLLGEIFR